VAQFRQMRQMMQQMGKTPKRKGKKGRKAKKGSRVTPKGGAKVQKSAFQLPTREEMEAQLPDALKGGSGGGLGGPG
jgi:hypothetical protein